MNLAHHMTEVVTVARAGDANNFGDTTYAAQTTIKARVEFGSQIVRGRDGSEIQSIAAVFTHTAIYETDRVWLPGDDTSSTTAARRAISVKKATPLSGSTTVYEAWF